MAEPKFGPAGNSESFAAAGFKKSEDAPAWLAQMGLTAFEYQCGRGVRCGEETALKIGAAAKQHGIQMSIHAPYFINLSSEESERMEKNVGYVLETARLVAEETAVRGYAPTFICESAGTQAEDALAMKQCFMAQAEK